MDPRQFLPKSPRAERTEFLLDCARTRSVVHIGCCGGLLDADSVRDYAASAELADSLHGKLATVAHDLCGVDISAKKIRRMRAEIPGSYVVCDVTDRGFANHFERTFDVVVLAECIEHVDDVATTLASCRSLMGPESQLVITTVNAYALAPISKMIARYESVNPEHTAYYSYFTLNRVLETNRFELRDFCFTWDRRSSFGGWTDRLTYCVGNGIGRVLVQFSQGIAAVARIRTGERGRGPASASA